MLNIRGGDPDGAVFDIGMTAFVALDLDPKCLMLIRFRECHDATRQRRRKQQMRGGWPAWS